MKKDIILYPFLFVVYPILFYMGHNKLWFSSFYIWICFIFLLGSLIFFFLLNYFVKNIHKSAFVTFLAVILFYQGNRNLPVNISLPITIGVFLATLIFSYFILKSNKDLNKVSKILNFISVVLIFLAFSSIFTGKIELNNIPKVKENYEVQNILNFESLHPTHIKDLPNIYYIIPDEYAGFYSLKKYYDFENSGFKDFLLKRGFYVPEKSYSNYGMTRLSVSSSLNMDYINYKIPTGLEDEIGLKHILDNNLIKILNAYDYETTIVLNDWHIARGDLSKTDTAEIRNWTSVISPVKISNINILRSTILRYLLFEYLRDNKRQEIHQAFNFLGNFSKQMRKNPQFIYFHVLFPHSPFLFDKNGNPCSLRQGNYLGQLKYTNILLERSVKTILENDKNAIIIIQSDHGQRKLAETTKDKSVRYNNIIAIYIPEKYRDKVKLYESITPVNIFRVILNPILHLDLKILPDKKVAS